MEKRRKITNKEKETKEEKERERERERERPFGTAVEQSGLSDFFANFVACIALFL